MKNLRNLMAWVTMMVVLVLGTGSVNAAILVGDRNSDTCKQTDTGTLDVVGIILADLTGIILADRTGIILADRTGIILADRNGCDESRTGIILAD